MPDQNQNSLIPAVQPFQYNQNLLDKFKTPQSQKQQNLQTQETATPTQITTNKNTPAKVLGNNQADVKLARLTSVLNPAIIDPSVFKDPTDRQAATLARAQRILANPKFKALDQSKKDQVLTNYYKKYVTATYKDFGYAIPDEGKWVRGIQTKIPGSPGFSPADYYDTSANSLLDHTRRVIASTIASGTDVFSHVAVAGINLGQAASRQFLNLDKFFIAHHLDAPDDPDNLANQTQSDWSEHVKKSIQKTSSQVQDTMGFWLDTHPSRNWTGHVDTFAGELLGTLPFYEAVGLPLKGAGALLKTDEGGSGALAKVANMSKVLHSTKGGTFVANRLENAAEGLIAGVMQGQKKEDIADNMMAWMAIGGASEAGGAILSKSAIAGTSLIKDMTGKILAMGGTPLQEAISQHAMYEMEHGYIGIDRNGQGVKVVLGEDGTSTSYIVNTHKDSVHTFTPKPEEAQAAKEKVLEEVHSADPVHAKLVTAEKITLTSLGLQKYGKPWNQLSQAQRKAIKLDRDVLTAETIKELPYHNQDLAKANTEAQIQQHAKENSYFAERAANIEKKYGIKVADSLHQAEMDYTAKATGIDNVENAAKTTGKAIEAVETARFVSRSEKLEQEPRAFASYKIDTLAYFKSMKSAYETTTSKDSLAKWVNNLSDEDVLQDLHEMAPQIKFEKDKDVLLWAYNYRNNIPKPYLDHIEDLLQKKVGVSERDWSTQAKNLEAHMENLAYTGQLFSKGNIFRSTDTTGSPTKWMRQHSREYRKQELTDYTEAMKPFAKRHKKEVVQGLKFLKTLQDARALAQKENEPRKAIFLSERIRKFAKEKISEYEMKAGK